MASTEAHDLGIGGQKICGDRRGDCSKIHGSVGACQLDSILPLRSDNLPRRDRILLSMRNGAFDRTRTSIAIPQSFEYMQEQPRAFTVRSGG